jgi:hypothetical protein
MPALSAYFYSANLIVSVQESIMISLGGFWLLSRCIDVLSLLRRYPAQVGYWLPTLVTTSNLGCLTIQKNKGVVKPLIM